MNDSMGIDKSNVEAINRWLDDHPGISGREAGRQLGIHESYIRRAKAARPNGANMRLAISDIIRTSATQPRVHIDLDVVERYALAKKNGAKFPPPVVFDDGKHKHMGDGFHRVEADLANGATEAEFEVRQGTERDAFLHGVRANSLNGLPFGRADRKRLAEWYHADDPSLSNRKIADIVGVSEGTIRNWLDVPVFTHSEPEPVGHSSDGGADWSDELDYAIEATGSPKPGEPDDWSDPDPAPPLPSLAVKRPPLPAEAPPEFEGMDPEPIKPLTDEEWLDTIPIRERLSDASRKVLDDDAVLWRKLHESPEAVAYLKLADRLANNRKVIGLRGPYQGKVSAYLRIKHPRSWLACGSCNGSGCDGCNRRGYVLS